MMLMEQRIPAFGDVHVSHRICGKHSCTGRRSWSRCHLRPNPAPATAPAKAASDKAAAKQKKADCTKRAKEQKMTGAARTKFMKECTSSKM